MNSGLLSVRLRLPSFAGRTEHTVTWVRTGLTCSTQIVQHRRISCTILPLKAELVMTLGRGPGTALQMHEGRGRVVISLLGLLWQEPQIEWLKQQRFFLLYLEARSPRTRCQRGWFYRRPLSLAWDGCLLPVSSHGLSSVCICLNPLFL